MPSILVTGSSRGLGKVTVEAFKADGWEVYGFDRSHFDFVKNGWDCVVPEVDAIIHCAGGGLGLRGPLLTARAFYELFMVNMGGAAEINRMILPHMMAKREGYIVHILSIASGEAVGSVGYNTIKAALGAYVRSLGREMAPYDVVITGVAPGAFLGPDNAMERLKTRNRAAYDDFVENRLPRQRMGEAPELLPLLKLLVSKGASMMGGSVISIDAGEGHYYSTP